MNLKAAVSFHGLLSALPGASLNPISTKILILHGYDDPLVKPEQMDQFAREMTTRKVDWQVHAYGLTAHSFTNPEANDSELGLHYNEKAGYRSWESTRDFLNEVLV